MKTNTVELAGDRHEFVTTEHEQHGFTNHRVVITTGQHITCTDSRIKEPVWTFDDLYALRYHLKMGCRLANTWLADSYRAALAFVSSAHSN